MNKEELIHRLSVASVEEGYSDNLSIVLASYFERHEDRPKDDPIDTELGWGVWVIEKTEEAIEYITEQITETR